jgi:hypothetical protein
MGVRRRSLTPGADRSIEGQQGSARGKQIRIAGKNEVAGPVGQRRGEREIRADARGLAGGDDDPLCVQGLRIST